MKKCLYFIFLILLIGIKVNAQEDDIYVSPFYVSISSGMDFNSNSYRDHVDSKGFTYYGISPHYNIGISASYEVTKKFRPRFETKYVKMSYGMNWTSSYTNFTTTDTKLNYWGINLFLDYKLINTPKFEMYISPGLKTEYYVGGRRITTEVDGDKNYNNYNVLSNYYLKAVAGGAISTIFKYNLSKKVGVFISPEYTYFFRKFAAGNSGNYQRFSTNMGLEFKFD